MPGYKVGKPIKKKKPMKKVKVKPIRKKKKRKTKK